MEIHYLVLNFINGNVLKKNMHFIVIKVIYFLIN